MADKKRWWATLLTWLQSDSALVFLMCENVMHAAWGKPVFKEIAQGKLLVAIADPVVCQFGDTLKGQAQSPADAMTREGRGKNWVFNSPQRLAMEARLRVIFDTMATR